MPLLSLLLLFWASSTCHSRLLKNEVAPTGPPVTLWWAGVLLPQQDSAPPYSLRCALPSRRYNKSQGPYRSLALDLADPLVVGAPRGMTAGAGTACPPVNCWLLIRSLPACVLPRQSNDEVKAVLTTGRRANAGI